MTELSIPALDWQAPNYVPIWAERMRALEALRKEPGKWPALKEFYKHNVVQFVIDFGSTYNPKNVGTDVPPTMPFILFQRQIEFLVWLEGRWKKRKDGVVEKSRDMGCTWLAVAFSVWLWLFWPESVTGFGSRKEDLVDNSFNSDSIFWKIRTFIKLLPLELVPEGFSFKKHSADMRILNPKNGASIIGEAGDNIGRGGRSTLYFKDESAFWEHPEECDSALSQNTNVQIDISTPGGEGIPFWHKVYSGNYDVFVFDWKEDPRKGPQWYADQKLRMTPTAIAQEIDRDHSASVNNSFISGSSVTAAMARGPADVMAVGPLMVGIDVARLGDDKTVMSFRRGRVLIKQISWGKTRVDASAGRCKLEIQRFKEAPAQIAVDADGVGGGVADLLRSWFGDLVEDVNSGATMDNGMHYNVRAFMWDQCREWIENGASIPNDQNLRVDLTGIRYKHKGGMLLMESKDDMRARGLKSPDGGDSLCLTLAKPVKRKSKPIDSRMVVDYAPMNEMGL